jgi:signal transduction histidine kinase
MAHDLLTPLTVVSTSVQVADMIPAKAPALLKKSQEEIMKMAGMINAALDESEREKNGSGN